MPVILMNAIIRYVASTFRNKIPFNSIRAILEMKIYFRTDVRAKRDTNFQKIYDNKFPS